MSTSYEEEDWESWENTEIPDLLVSIQNKERELKLLEERKQMEEADLALAEDLFSASNNCNKKNTDLALLEPINFGKQNTIKKLKPKKLQIQQEIKQKEQKEQTKKLREKKAEAKRHKELYGEAEIDQYEEQYGYLEDEY